MKSGRVLLINPPSEPSTTANREGSAGLGNVYPYEGAFLYPPHTLATVAAVLRQDGWALELRDAVVEDMDVKTLVDYVSREGFQIIGVFVSHATLDVDIGMLRRLRGACPDAYIIAFGPAMRFVGPQVWERGEITAVLMGEPELLFPAACRCLAGGGALSSLLRAPDLGVVGCDADGWILDLDAVPYPAWDLLPWRKYRFLSIMSSRGCDDLCAYCPYVAAQGHRFRPRSASSVVAELSWLVERYAPRRVVFRDPVFARDRQRVLNICSEIRMRPELGTDSRFTWECESRPEQFDADLLRQMKEAGCGWIKIGLETTGEEVLRRMNRLRPDETREEYVSQVAEVVRACREVGVRCRVFAMVGLPGQEDSVVADTLIQLRRMSPTALGVKALEHYPGARWKEEISLMDEELVQRQMIPFLELREDLGRALAPPRQGRFMTLLSRLKRRWKQA